MKTYCFKLYQAKRNKKIRRVISIAGCIYNHCIALHKRYYRLFGKSLNSYRLQKHLTKLKKTAKCGNIKSPDVVGTFCVKRPFFGNFMPDAAGQSLRGIV